MKITDITTYIVSQQLDGGESFAYSQYWYNTRTIMLLKMETDAGIVGWGESFGPATVNKAIIENVYKPIVLGRDPFDSEVIWDELYNKLRDHGQKGVTVEAISAIDIALWDIKGKAVDLPVYKLMGGAPRSRVMPYATGLYRRRVQNIKEELVREALDYVSQGFKAIKLKIGFGVEDDIKTLKEIRRAVGDKVLLMVDANHAYNASNAIKLARKMEDLDIFWFEEPVPPEDIEGYIEVKSRTYIPIAGGEAEFTRYGFNNLISKRAVDIIQPDCCVTGGISEFKKISVLASIQNIQCYPHIWGSAIALHTGIHCALSLPHFPPSLNPDEVLLEYDRTPNVFRENLAINKIKMAEGFIYPSEKPGLGIDIDEELIKKYEA